MNTDNGPTHEFYDFLTRAFRHFNLRLFKGQLPSCLITVQREKSTMGFFSPNRWGNQEGKTAHEIALNPSYFANHRLIEIFQTLVHEQCHLWQHTFGKKISRAGYHNKEWAEKMESIGLMPSDSGEPGGKRTGQRMSDYPITNGKFISASEELVLQKKNVLWVDLHPANSPSSQKRNTKEKSVNLSTHLFEKTISELIPGVHYPELIVSKRLRKQKIKYTCSAGCGSAVWGKPGLKMYCGQEGCNHSPYKSTI